MKNRINKKYIALSALSLMAGTAMANPLEAELRRVATDHPGVRAARLAESASEKRYQAALSAFLPRLSLSGDNGREQVESTSYKPLTQAERDVLGGDGTKSPSFSRLNRSMVALTLEQSLFDGGRRRGQAKISELDKEIQGFNVESQKQDVLLEATTAYLQVARYLTLIRLATLNEETTQQQLELERKRLSGGGGIAVDVLQARTRLQIVRERRVFFEQGLRDAIATYEQVFVSQPSLKDIQDVMPFDERMPNSVANATERGLSQNVRLRISAKQIERARAQIDADRAGFLPSVDLVGLRSSGRNVGQVYQKDESSILVKFNWTLYAGGETLNRAAAAANDYQEQIERQSVTRNKVLESIRMTWNQMVNGRERMELLDSAASIARDVMEDRKRLRDAGKESALIVLDSEVEYYGVLSSKVNAIFDTRISSFRLLSLMGELTAETMGLQEGKFNLLVQPLSVELSALAAPSAR